VSLLTSAELVRSGELGDRFGVDASSAVTRARAQRAELTSSLFISVFIWLAAFSQSWTNIPWTVSAELPSEALRDKTLAIGAFGGYAVGTIVGLVNPYMQNAEYGNLGGKVGFVCESCSFAPTSRASLAPGILSPLSERLIDFF
jgi:hypothetical protein